MYERREQHYKPNKQKLTGYRMRAFVGIVEIGLLCVAQDGLELAILYPQLPVSHVCNSSQLLLRVALRVGPLDKKQQHFKL